MVYHRQAKSDLFLKIFLGYVLPVPEPRPSPIRASGKTKEILAKWTKHFGVAQTDLLEQFVKAADQHIEHHGGRLILPLNFGETFTVLPISPKGQAVVEIRHRQKSARSR